MNNNTDQQLQELLDKLYNAKDYTLFTTALYGNTPMMDNAIRRIDGIMMDNGLIEEHKEVRTLSDFGQKICESGGWKAYLSRKEQQNRIEEDRIRKQDQKLTYDLRISKYLYKTRWWPLIISAISLAVAMWALFK